jgi:hypothetical protein
MPVPNARFIELLEDIEPSPTTKGNGAAARELMREHLRNQVDFKSLYLSSFLSGSSARDTAIRPRRSADGVERPDIDIIVVTAFSPSDAPEAVLKRVCRAVEDNGYGYTVDRINRRSVRVTTSRAEMDIVPVIREGDGYLIADRESGAWKFTNPPKHGTWSSQQNTFFAGRFKPMVKLFKWWRRENPNGSKRPKGFVLECLVSHHARIGEAHYGEAFARLLENIRDAYRLDGGLIIKPAIPDPAVPGNDIMSKVTQAKWRDFVEKVAVHAAIARKAQDADDLEEATRQWRRIFGGRFRATQEAARASSLGGFVAAAPAPAAGYRFPNAMAAPVKKPRGFA